VNLDRDALMQLLATKLPQPLAASLVDEFIQLRVDVATGTLGRSSAGKFVETLVKALQQLDTSQFEKKPDVDGYLRKLDSSSSSLDDGLKVCASRVARSVYTLRNKRSIAHAGEVDPNPYDLAYLLHGVQWTLAELVRVIAGSTMAQAGELVASISAPVGGLVDDLGGRKVVLADVAAHEEVLILMHHEYPAVVAVDDLKSAMRRRAGSTIRNAINKLWREKLIEGDAKSGYRLTGNGYKEANTILTDALAARRNGYHS
jgi:hypothetical protein